MKLILALLACCYAGAVAQGQESAKRAKIERILEITQASGDAVLVQMNEQMRTAMQQAASASATPEQKAAAQAQFEKTMDVMRTLPLKMRPLYIQLYDENFSDQEIDGMLAFYESPAGRAMLTRTPVIMSRMAAAMIPELQRLMAEMRAK